MNFGEVYWPLQDLGLVLPLGLGTQLPSPSALPLYPLAISSLGILNRKSSICVASLFDFSLYNYPSYSSLYNSLSISIFNYHRTPLFTLLKTAAATFAAFVPSLFWSVLPKHHLPNIDSPYAFSSTLTFQQIQSSHPKPRLPPFQLGHADPKSPNMRQGQLVS